MRIAFILPSNIKCAPNFVALKIIQALIDTGNEVHVFVFRHIHDFQDICYPCCVTKITLFSNISFSNFDIAHSMGFKADFFLAKARLTLQLLNCKTVTTLHSDFDLDLYDLYGLKGYIIAYLWWFFCLFANARVCLNSYQLRRIPFFYNRLNFIIPNSIDSIRTVIHGDRNNNQILYCGAIRKIKGLDILLKSMKFNPSFNLSVAGAGKTKYSNYCDKLIRAENLSERVKFLGHVSNIELIYSQHQILVVPSRSEGFGLVVLEALTRGLLVICNDIPSFRELFNDLPVYFYKTDDPVDLARVIKNTQNMKINQMNSCPLPSKYKLKNFITNYFDVYQLLITTSK